MNSNWKGHHIKISQKDSDDQKLNQVITFNCKKCDRSVSQYGHSQILLNNYDPMAIDYRIKINVYIECINILF